MPMKPMMAVPFNMEPEPRKTPAQLEREGMWHDAQMERLHRRGDHDAEYFMPYEKHDSNVGFAYSGFPGVKAPVRDSMGIRSINSMMSEGYSLNTGNVYRGPGRGLKLGNDE